MTKSKCGRSVSVNKKGIKRMFRDGVKGLGRNAEKIKDDVAPRVRKATEAFKKFDALQLDESKGKPKKYISLNL
jgi:hypothetical protein